MCIRDRLSYSTLGSGKGEDVDKMREASEKLKAMYLPFPVEGEIQFDAAFAPEVGKLKAPGSKVAGEANVFIFPDINAGNIGYKIAQRLGGFEAVGPILQGLAANIDVYKRQARFLSEKMTFVLDHSLFICNNQKEIKCICVRFHRRKGLSLIHIWTIWTAKSGSPIKTLKAAEAIPSTPSPSGKAIENTG